MHFLFETNLKDTICLINNKGLQIVEKESTSVLEVIKETTGGGNEQVNSVKKLLDLSSSVGASHDDTECVVVILEELRSNSINLKGKLSGGGNDDSTSSVTGLEVCLNEELYSGDQESKSLTGTGASGTEKIPAKKESRNRLGLDLHHCFEAHITNSLLCKLADLQGLEFVVLGTNRESLELTISESALLSFLLLSFLVGSALKGKWKKKIKKKN
jgi:hypothetical protein